MSVARVLRPLGRWLSVVLLLASAPLFALTEQRGQTPSGAYYVMQKPDGWQAGGTLVLINHGYHIDPPEAGPSLGPAPLRARMLAKGFAIAASSYSQRGWALFATERDHRELIAAFTARFGQPGALIASGGSLGGLVTMQQAEQTDLGAPVVGAYAVCAPLAGSRVWEQALDIRLAYDRVCDNVTGGELPRGDDAFPYILKASDLEDYAEPTGGGEIALRVSKCTGYGLPSWLVTSGMRSRYEQLKLATGVHPDFFLENMFYATYGLADIYRDSAKIGGRAAISSAHVVYPDLVVQRDIRRVSADVFASLDLKRHFTPTGQVGNAKVLTTHTSGDGLVVPEHARALEGKLPAAQWSRAVVVESTPSHCGYSDAELLGGFEALTEWIAGSAQPTATSIQSACQRERTANPSLGACRYDASYVPGDINSKLKPRNDPAWPIDASASGLWFDPARPGEGFVVEALPARRVSVTWFTYPVAGSSADQAWYTGVGKVIDNNLIVDRMEGRRGGRFGADFNPAELASVALGRFDVALTSCGTGEQRVTAPAPFGNARRPFRRLSRIGSARCPGDSVPAAPSSLVRWSGSWFDPAKPGRGIFLQVQDDGRAFLVWFTYRADGEAVWMVGEGVQQANDLVFSSVARPVGTRFGSAFDAAAVRQEAWGNVRLSGNGCTGLNLSYASTQPGYGSGSFQFTRLTTPIGAGCP